MIRAFISSTYRDLHSHRAYVIERLARSGIFVDPMEKWTAAADEPKTLSQERVKGAQLCILLVGFRRGHVPEGETQSITQLEYREALRRGIDVLVFLASEEADWPAESIATLQSDPETRSWRAKLMEHTTTGFFTPRPESIDVDAALNRWLQSRAELRAGAMLPHPRDAATSIEIRAHGNSEGVLVVWRVAQPINSCLGFAIFRRVLGDAGVTEEVVTTTFAVWGAHGALAGEQPSTSQPVQNFRWFDRGQREVRYRVVPVLGTPDRLTVADGAGSGWTGWVSPAATRDPLCRAFFNAPQPSLLSVRAARNAGSRATAKDLRAQAEDQRERWGGGLRRSLLATLCLAKLSEQRVFAALSELDDADLAGALAQLGSHACVVLGPEVRVPPAERSDEERRQRTLQRRLRSASVRLYAGSSPGHLPLIGSFVVLCDKWGTPMSVWVGTSAWTTRSLCLRSNSGVLVESLALARAYLDRWNDLRDACDLKRPSSRSRGSAPISIDERGVSFTLWNTPAQHGADLRDVRRLIRGARQGVLFLLNARRVADELLQAVLGLAEDDDLLVEGILWEGASSARRVDSREWLNKLRTHPQVSLSLVGPELEESLLLVDPFGPHPVLITGSHDLVGSAKSAGSLLVVENAHGLAAEYSVHLLGLVERYRWLEAISVARDGRDLIRHVLQPTDAWQQRFFSGRRRSEFNFLFGLLSPGL